MRFFWFFLTLLAVSTWQTPAWAGQLLSWEFDSQRRQLQFKTNEGVQPQAQLVPNPSRLVIDLPGTVFGQPMVNRSYGGRIISVRVGQFNPQTTRLVAEIAPGYTLDPNDIKFEGISPTQWKIDIPEPQPIPDAPAIISNASSNSSTSQSVGSGGNGGLGDRLQVTQGGFFIRLNQNSQGKISTKKTNKNTLEFNIQGLQLPADLVNKTVAVNSYKVETIDFVQVKSDQARIALKLDEDSPGWRAIYSQFGGGGLVLLPDGGTDNLGIAGPTNLSQRITVPASTFTTVEGIDLANNSTQLILRGNNRLEADGGWNRNEGVYQIRIANAVLAQPVQGPQLGNDSPISRISMRQETNDIVVVTVEPALGVQIGSIRQPSDNLVSLDLRRLRTATSNAPISVPPTVIPRPTTASLPSGSALVMLDPGHGGKDPGAIGIGGIQEKNIILPISLEVAQILKQQGISVRFTRDSDYFVSLQGRTDLANRANADLFVSIHANAISLSRPDINGLEVYYYQTGKGLAQSIHRNILQQVNIRDRGIRTARFYVLRHTAMPSVLVEVGFVTGREDAPNLSNPTYRSQMAKAIADGIIEYVKTNVR